MKKQSRHYYLILFIFLIIFAKDLFADEILIGIQDLSYNPGTTGILIPIHTEDVTGDNIVSVEFSVSYNPDVIEISGISIQNSLIENFDYNINCLYGSINFAGFGIDPIIGGGDLCFLEIDLKGNEDDFTEIIFNDFTYNEGNIQTKTENGSVFIGESGSIEGEISLNGGAGNICDVSVSTNGGYIFHPDKEGSYRIITQPDTLDITASLDDYNTEIITDVIVNANQTITGKDLSLEPILGFITGEVVIIAGSGKVEDVIISANGVSVNPNTIGLYFLSISPGIYDLIASLENYSDSTIYNIAVIEDSTEELNFTLSPIPGTLEGHVFVYGGSCNNSDVLISAGNFTTHPNLSGFYSMDIFPGIYTVTASLPNYELKSVDNIEIIKEVNTTQDFIINYLNQPNSIWIDGEENAIVELYWNSTTFPSPESYKLLRRYRDENWQDWISVSGNISDTTYMDNLQQEPDGEYKYGVQAVYSSGLSDTIISSNIVTLDRFVNIEIIYSLNNGFEPSGISYELTCNDSIYNQLYQGETAASGITNLEDIYKGEFSAIFSKPAYSQLIDTIVVTVTDTIFYFELEEIFGSPENASLKIDENYEVEIAWEIPAILDSTVSSYNIYRKFDTNDYILISDEISDKIYYDDLYSEPDGNYQYGCQAVYTTGTSDTIETNGITLNRFTDIQIGVSLSDSCKPSGIIYQISGLDSIYSQTFEGATLDSGKIDLSGVFYADYFIILSKEDYYTLEDNFTVLENPNQFSFSLDPKPGIIQGSVSLSNGNSCVENVEISAGDYIVNPDTTGYYGITIPQGNYDVTAYLYNYEDSTITNVEVTKNDTTNNVNFTLDPLIGCIAGTATLNGGNGDTENIQINAVSTLNPDSVYSANPDSTGYYQIILPAGIYDVTATLEDYYDSSLTEIEVLENLTTNEIDFCLNPILGFIQGNVIIVNGSGCTVDVEVTAEGIPPVNPDLFGNYEIALPAGIYDVTATLEDYFDSTITDVQVITGQSTVGIDFSLSAIPGFIEGNITLEEGGSGHVEDVTITAGNISAYPDTSGFYRFPVIPGTYNVQAGMLGYEIQQQSNIIISQSDTTIVNFFLKYLPEPSDIFLNNLTSDYIAHIFWTPINQKVNLLKDEPMFLSYTVCRKYFLNVWYDWEIIAENITDTLYSDNLQQQPDGYYFYGVQAVYDIGVSKITQSNYVQIYLERFVDVEVTVTTNDGSNPYFVSYDILGLDQIYNQHFTGITDSIGIFNLSDVYKTNYYISLDKEGYNQLTDTITVSDSTYQFHYELQESYLAPLEITSTINDTFTVEIYWTANLGTDKSPLYYKLSCKFSQPGNWEIIANILYDNYYLDNLKDSPDGDYQYGIQTVYTTGVSDTTKSEVINISRYVDIDINISLSDGEPAVDISYIITGLDSIYQQQFSGTNTIPGMVGLANVYKTDYLIILSKATYDTLYDTISVISQGQQFNFTLNAKPGCIEGTVNLVNGDGNVQDVQIIIGTTILNPDSEGNYSIMVPAGIYNLTASLDEYIDSTIVGIEVFRDQTTGNVNFGLLQEKAIPTLYIFQNPYLTQYAQIVANIIYSNADSVELSVNSIPVSLNEITENCYFGKYKFSYSGEYIIKFSTFNSGGDSTITRFFTVVKLGEQGGSGSSYDKKLSICFPAGSLPENNFIIITDSSLAHVNDKDINWIYQIGPDGLILNKKATLEFQNQTPDKAVFYFQNNSWVELPTVFKSEKLITKIDKLGFFRLKPSDNTLILNGFSQNYPNPFTDKTNINFTIKTNGSKIKLSIYNVKGQLIKILQDRDYDAGLFTVTWDGKDHYGDKCSPGIYFINLSDGEENITKKLILLR